MKFTVIKYEVTDSVAKITLNRPEVLNAMNGEMFEELNAVFDKMAADSGVRAILITGEGRGFCSGADLKEMGSASVMEPGAFKSYMRVINELILKMTRLDKPIVAAVNGPATGAGANLALASDIIFMAKDAYICQIFVKRGLVPDFGGLYLLPRYVGMAKAKELLFTGDRVEGDEAVRLGMANRSLPLADLLPEATKFAQKLASGPTIAIGLAKQGVHRGLESGLDAVLEFESLAQAIVRTTGDTFEAISAFLEKREPNFQGK